jgi:hypothetical protein
MIRRAACILLFSAVLGAGQSPPANLYPLPPEASKAYLTIVQAQADLQRQYAALESNRVALLLGANVPKEARNNCTASTPEMVACSRPEPSPTPK